MSEHIQIFKVHTQNLAQFWKRQVILLKLGEMKRTVNYLPSPPQPLLGVMVTSRHESVSELYTYSFNGLPSWESIRVNRSSD